jgi:uncharacterized protein YkwD
MRLSLLLLSLLVTWPAHAESFRVSGPGSARYAEPTVAPKTTPDLDLLSRAIVEAGGKHAPRPDARHFAAAADLAKLGGDAPSYPLVELALWHHGIIEPSPYVIVVTATNAQLAEVASDLKKSLAPVLAASPHRWFGVGIAPQGKGVVTVVVMLHESALDLAPIPRRLEAKGQAAISGTLLGNHTGVELILEDDDGKIRKAPLRLEGKRFQGAVTCPGAGRLKVELLGMRGTEPDVIANFPLWCGQAPPVSAERGARTAETTDAAAAEREIFALLNADRKRAGLGPLLWDDKAAGIARAHSVDMRDHGFVSHVSKLTGDPEARARRGGLVAPLILENLARSYSPAEVHTGLMGSPGHRSNILHAKATHVGIGVALNSLGDGRSELYTTQVFYGTPRQITAADALAAVRTAIDATRKAKGVKAAVVDADLSRAAQALAEAKAKGTAPAGAALDGLAGRYAKVVTISTAVADAEDAVSDKLADQGVVAFGIGLARGNHPTLGDGVLFVVIHMAYPR